MKKSFKVGDKVIIKGGWRDGEWGKVILVDEDGFYHVAIFEDKNECPIFDKSELKKM